MHDLVIYGGKCWIDKKLVECCIALDGNKISYIGKEDVKGEVNLNAKNCIVLPAFFNAHTHAAMTLLRGVAEGVPFYEWLNNVQMLERDLRDEDVYWGSLLACLEMIKNGVAAFSDMYIYMDSVAEAVIEAGMRAALGYGMADRGNPDRAEEELKEGIRFAEKWNDFSRITTFLAPHAPYSCSPEFLKKISEYDYLKHIHVSETLWEVKEIKKRYGTTPVKLLNEIGFLDSKTVAAHCVWLNEEEIKILSEKGVSVAHCPASNMKLGAGIAKIREMIDRNVNVCLGTDGAASNNNLNILHEMRIAALLQLLRKKPLKAVEILKMATENGYKAYKINGGRIEVEKLADLVVLKKDVSSYPFGDENSIVFASIGCEANHLIVDGRIVMEDREILTLNEEKVLSQAEKRARRLISKFS